MRHLTFILTAVLVVLVAYACSNPTGSDFEEQRFGNWLLVSETQANYVGDQKAAKQKGDTLYINDNDRIDLKLVDLETKRGAANYFDVVFADSQFVYEYDMEVSADAWANDYMFTAGGGSYTVNESGFFAEIQSQYACADEDHQFNDMNIANYVDDELHTHYIIDIDGIRETLDEMFGC